MLPTYAPTSIHHISLSQVPWYPCVIPWWDLARQIGALFLVLMSFFVLCNHGIAMTSIWRRRHLRRMLHQLRPWAVTQTTSQFYSLLSSVVSGRRTWPSGVTRCLHVDLALACAVSRVRHTLVVSQCMPPWMLGERDPSACATPLTLHCNHDEATSKIEVSSH
jgi:hypothetical protein